MKIYIYYVAIIMIIIGCKENEVEITKDEQGVIVKKSYIWKTNYTIGTSTVANFGKISPPVIFENNIIQGGETNNQPFVWMTNIENGSTFWAKDFSSITNDIRFSHKYLDNIIFIGNNNDIFSLNLPDATVEYRTNVNVNFWNWITGIDDYFFAGGFLKDESNQFNVFSAWIGDSESGELHEFYKPDMGEIQSDSVPWIGIGGVDRIIPFKNSQGDINTAIFIYKQYNERTVFSNLLIYNVSKDLIVINQIDFNKNTELILGQPEVFENCIYFTTTSDIYCVDLETGKRKWVTNYNNYFSSEGHVIADGKIIALIDGSIKELVCHDIYTGQQLWITPSEGTSSTLNYLNGVVYFASMGDGRIHAVDAQTGKYLWHIEPPDNSGLKDECAVIPGQNGEKGKVIVSTFLNGYCYEAER